MANTSDSASAEASQPKRGLFSRKPKTAKGPKQPGRLKQIGQVFQMTRRHDPSVVWLMLLAFLGITAVGLILGLILGNWITFLLISLPLGLLAAVAILSRRARRAAFAQIKDRPGAAGAALSELGRGWVVKDQPVAVAPRTQDLVFAAIGRPGVVLVTEGPSGRVRPLVEAERKRMGRVLPNVPIHIVNSGSAEGQTSVEDLAKAIKKLPKALGKQEIHQVDRRLSTLGSAKLPIPKGIDPNRARPDRRAMRGR